MVIVIVYYMLIVGAQCYYYCYNSVYMLKRPSSNPGAGINEFVNSSMIYQELNSEGKQQGNIFI